MFVHDLPSFFDESFHGLAFFAFGRFAKQFESALQTLHVLFRFFEMTFKGLFQTF